MGDDPIATILEFLQRYNLSHTEATLRSELQGRQGAHECIIVGEQSEESFSLAGFARTETATGIDKEQLSIDTESNSSNRTHLLKPRLENFSFVDVKSSKEQSHNHLTVEVNGSLWQGRRRELVNFTLDQIAPNVEEVSKYAKHRDEDSKMVSTEKKIQSHTYAQENVHKTESLDLMFCDVAQNKDQTRLASVQAQSIEHHGQRRKMDETGQDQLKGISLYESRNGTGPSNPEVTQFNKAMIISETKNYSGVVSSLNRDKIITSRALPDSEYGNIFNDPCGGLSESGWFNGGQVEGILVTNSIRGCPPFLVSSAANFSSTQELDLTKKAAYRRMEDATLMHLKKEPGNETPLSWDTNFYNDNIGFVGCENIKGYKVQSNNDFSTLPQLRLGSLDMGEDPYSDGFRLDCLVDIGPSTNMVSTLPSSFELGCYLDVSMGQDIAGNKWLSVNGATGSEGIVEESPELLSGFATLGDDGLDDPNVGFSLQHWGSDTYDDDDDPGYIRQPIEDEAWFMANEIDYLSDEDGAKSNKESDAHLQKDTEKLEGDLSALEELDCSSGEQVCSFYLNDPQDVPTTDKESKSLSSKGASIRKDFVSPSLIDTYSYGGQLTDTKKLKLRKGEFVQQSFIVQNSLTLGDNVQKLLSQAADSYGIDYERQGSERSSEAEQGREARYSASGDSSEGNVESLRDEEPSDYDTVYSVQEKNDNVGCRGTPEQTGGYYDEAWSHKIFNSNKKNSIAECGSQRQGGYGFQQNQNQVDEDNGGISYGGFSFPYPLSMCNLAGQKEESEKSLRAMQPNLMGFYDMDIYSNAVSGPDDTFSTWKRKSSESSPMISPSQEAPCNEVSSSVCSTLSPPSSGGYAVLDKRNQRVALGGQNETEGAEATTAAAATAATADEDDEIVAIQEQIRQIKAEEEFEIFDLRIIHRKDRTGFEEEKNFPVILNSIVAGRYHVTEYLGSAAFSKAIQVHDLRTGMDVCMKIIKNNKDFFDQSLDEIKILKYVNRHDPADKYHLLRLYDYFYYHEHLFIVCELLRANLYEFQKFNRESGGEIYFTMSRLQSITRQCLEAVEFLHHLGLIHCDLKPENILIKSYSRCEIKVIDLGSSCFQTDLLCPYVQSRSYRAPEVILGLPYNHKIDIWSLGCILAELCSGHVLFQNDSLATLLARVIGIIGPIDPEMLAKGRYTHKYFTKSHMLYERNPETNQLEYLLPKKTSLRHRLPSGDQGFVDFVAYLLQVNPENRPTSTEALKHPWLSYPYEPILS